MLIQHIQGLSQEMRKCARFIAAHPELAYEEYQSMAILTQLLKKHRFKIRHNAGQIKTAFVATQEFSFSKTIFPSDIHIGFMAEYDALPGIGHACGHNLVGVASAGAAIALAEALKRMHTPIKTKSSSIKISVIGCPAEEGGGGKILLTKRGVFRDLSVAMMIHPDDRTEMVKRMLSLIECDIEFSGRASHAAAAPHLGINALDAAVETYAKILVFRKTLSKDARVHGIFSSAGQKPNIIPDHAGLKYYVRSLDMKKTYGIIKKIEIITRQYARKYGAKVTITKNPLAYEPFQANRYLNGIFRQQLRKMGASEVKGVTQGMGSSDVGNVSQVVPTIHPLIKICTGFSCHTPAFAKAAASDKGIQGMVFGANVLALTGLALLKNPKHIIKIKKEFKRFKR